MYTFDDSFAKYFKTRRYLLKLNFSSHFMRWKRIKTYLPPCFYVTYVKNLIWQMFSIVVQSIFIYISMEYDTRY